MIPTWSISADGTDISERLAAYLVALSIVDQSGLEPDELSLTVADPRAALALPRLGARLEVALGYAHTGTVAMGAYLVDTAELSSPPRQLEIRARSAELAGSFKTRKTKAWEGKSVGAIVQEIAAQHGLTAAVGQDLAGLTVARIDQTNESDPSFLTRLGQLYDAIATVKSARLVFARRGQGAAVTGLPIAPVALAPADVTAWRLSLSETEKYDAVEARTYDRTRAKEEWVRDGKADAAAVLRLRPTFPDRAQALAAAKSRRAALARGQTAASLTLPGRTDLAAETPLQLTGFARELDGRWICTTVTHRLDANGYTVELEAERPDPPTS